MTALIKGMNTGHRLLAAAAPGLFVLKVKEHELYYPAMGGKPPEVFGSKRAARRKLKREMLPERWEMWEVVPFDPATMKLSAPELVIGK